MAINPTAYWQIFATGFMSCVLVIPLVVRLAHRLGAVDRPDNFRKVHQGTVPRLGGLALALSILASFGVALALHQIELPGSWWIPGAVVVSALVILIVGGMDDVWGINPRMKLLGQMIAASILYAAGVQIHEIWILKIDIPLGWFALPVTLLWLLGTMNVWNLIDGMDGLATGVGFLVTVTLMLVAVTMGHGGMGLAAAAIAGALLGFLLYNWHPACIFLGDSGSMLVGLLIGVIGVQGTLKKSSAVALGIPILTMGLPITDTVLAIFRRWARRLPLSASDRKHVHHILVAMGLTPRQAALFMYSFSACLCGLALAGLAFQNEILALGLGLFGILAFVLVSAERRALSSDLVDRLTRWRVERDAARIAWETIQRIELGSDPHSLWNLIREVSQRLGCAAVRLTTSTQSDTLLEWSAVFVEAPPAPRLAAGAAVPLSGECTVSFRVAAGPRVRVELAAQFAESSAWPFDLTTRHLKRLVGALAVRFHELSHAGQPAAPPRRLPAQRLESTRPSLAGGHPEYPVSPLSMTPVG